MSNHLSIAAATATLAARLRIALGDGVEVKHNRPDGKEDAKPPDHGVNIFLYHVKPSAAFRSFDLPTRNAAGTVTSRPTYGIELHYLLTFHGDDSKLEPQRYMGKVLTALHTEPVPTGPQIESATDEFARTFTDSGMEASNLHEQIEAIRFTPMNLTLEETSQIWSVMVQTPYVLSACYQASVILLEADIERTTVLPVLERKIVVSPTGAPVISSAEVSSVQFGKGSLVLLGQNLGGEGLSVVISGALSDLVSGSTSERALVKPGAEVRAGKQEVWFESASPFTGNHPSNRSNSVDVTVHPCLTHVAVAGSRLTLEIEPNVHPGQVITLVLTQVDAVAGEDPLHARIKHPDPEVPLSKLEFRLDDVRSASYNVRISVDESQADGGVVEVP